MYRAAPQVPIWGRDPIFMRKPSLFTQILAVNSALIAGTAFAATVASSLDLAAAAQQRPFLVLLAAILATILVNAMVLRRRLAPLERVIETMERVDLGRPGLRVDETDADSADVARLHASFNRMLERLEDERARAARAVLRAQETERARIARDLHDEANQALTGLLLRLEAAAAHAPGQLHQELQAAKAVAGQAMEELLRLARELRPSTLDDHGLDAALRTQVDRFARHTGLDTRLAIEDEATTGLSEDEQLVVYRIVQEGLSNAARHAEASKVRVALALMGGYTVVRVADDGCGFRQGEVGRAGHGLAGMRERALLAGGRLAVRSLPGSGTTVELVVGGSR
jgi:two-component system sensor histidine kinase UhpB